MNEILQRPINTETNFPDKFFIQYYKSDPIFHNLIDDIDGLAVTKDSYFLNSSQILDRISSLTGPAKKEWAYSVFKDKFYSLINTNADINTDINERIAPRRKSFANEMKNAEDSFQTFVAFGSDLSKSDLPSGIGAYSMAYYLAAQANDDLRMAYIESRYGDAYFNTRNPSYVKKSADCYFKAADHYLLAGDTSSYLVTNLLATEVLIDTDPFDNESLRKWSIIDFGNKNLIEHIKNGAGNISESVLTTYKNTALNRDMLEAAYDMLTSPTFMRSGEAYHFYEAIGVYFIRKGDTVSVSIGEKYLNAALITEIINNHDYRISHIINPIIKIFWDNEWLGNYSESDQVFKEANEFAQHENSDFHIHWLKMLRAGIQDMTGHFRQGLSTTYAALSYVDSNRLFPYDADRYAAQGYETLYKLYKDLNMPDSSEYYKSKFSMLQIHALDEFADIDKILASVSDAISEEHLAKKNARIDQMQKVIESKQMFLSELNRVLGTKQAMIFSQGTLIKAQKDSLLIVGTQVNIAKQLNDTLNAKNKQAAIDLSTKSAELNDTIVDTIKGSILALVIFSLVLALLIVRYREKVMFARVELNALAKGKLHNLKNGYLNFVELINSDQHKANEYAIKNTAYLKKSLADSNWVEKDYKLSSELKLLQSHFEAEKILYPNFIIDDADIDPEINTLHTLFITEVFTTLLDNSIEHNFRYCIGQELCVFKITIGKVGKWLKVEVRDTGRKLDDSTVFFKHGSEHRGLSLLRSRVKAEIKFRNAFWVPKNFFTAVANSDSGATIKFLLPYESSV